MLDQTRGDRDHEVIQCEEGKNLTLCLKALSNQLSLKPGGTLEQAGGDLGWRRDIKGKTLGMMALTVMANNYRKSQTSASGHAVVGATGFGDTSWRRCVSSQVCRGEMKGWLLGSAQLGLNLLSAPFPSR